jgi:hypothetical protein
MSLLSKKHIFTDVGDGELLRNGKSLGKVSYSIEVYETPDRPDEISGVLKSIDKIEITELLNQELVIRLASGQFCRCKIINDDGQIAWVGKAIFMLDLDRAAMRGIEEAVQWHTLGIVSNYEGLEGKGIGTGNAIQWKEQRIILTAAHVVKDTDWEKLWFFTRPEGTIQRVESTSVHSLHRDAKICERIPLPIRDVIINEEDDLALLVLPHDSELNQKVQFFELTPALTVPDHTSSVLMIGYPSDLSIEIDQGNHVVFTSTQWTNLLDQDESLKESKYLRGCDPMKHILAQFTNALFAKRHPRGFSGAGCWFRKGSSGEGSVWNSNLSLAGIVTDYYAGEKLLKMARIEVVNSFLERALK